MKANRVISLILLASLLFTVFAGAIKSEALITLGGLAIVISATIAATKLWTNN